MNNTQAEEEKTDTQEKTDCVAVIQNIRKQSADEVQFIPCQILIFLDLNPDLSHLYCDTK